MARRSNSNGELGSRKRPLWWNGVFVYSILAVLWSGPINADPPTTPGENCIPQKSYAVIPQQLTAIGDITAQCVAVNNHGEPPLMEGKLSAFWGYDFVGVDLAHETLSKIANNLVPARIATIEDVDLARLPTTHLLSGIVDHAAPGPNDARDPHGTEVASIIAGADPYGIALKPVFVAIGANRDNPADMHRFSKEVLSQRANILEASHGFDDSWGKSFLQNLENNGVITVRSSGNFYPSTDDNGTPAKFTITVGNLSPLGGMAASSSSFEGVTIAAPGRVYAEMPNGSELFGGTSGAQPVVAGCIANVVSLLPGITPEEAKTMVVNTAIPTLNSKQHPNVNGVGTINCLKLAEVGKRLAQRWPESRKAIHQPTAIYSFNNEANDALRDARRLNDVDPCQQGAKLKLLRRAFLLNPSKEIASDLSALYAKTDYPMNALLYKSIRGFTADDIKDLALRIKGDELLEPDFIRLVGENLPSMNNVLLSFVGSSNPLVRQYVLFFADLPSDQAHEAFLRKFTKDEMTDGDAFFSVYFDKYHLPAKDLLDVCRTQLSSWNSSQGTTLAYKCMDAANYSYKSDPGDTIAFLTDELINPAFRSIVLDYCLAPGNPFGPALSKSVQASPDWSESDRHLLELRSKQAPGNQ